jgi:hypothetical protein
MARTAGYARCEAGVVKTLTDLLQRQLDYAAHDGDDFLDATANARLVKNAEAYYRAMYYGAADSWNLRDTHMFETLERGPPGQGDQRQGRGLGAQLPHRRRLQDRDGPGAGRAEHRPAVPRAVRRRPPP